MGAIVRSSKLDSTRVPLRGSAEATRPTRLGDCELEASERHLGAPEAKSNETSAGAQLTGDLPWQGVDENQANIIVSGMIQQATEMMFIVRDRCCEKNILDLREAAAADER